MIVLITYLIPFQCWNLFFYRYSIILSLAGKISVQRLWFTSIRFVDIQHLLSHTFHKSMEIWLIIFCRTCTGDWISPTEDMQLIQGRPGMEINRVVMEWSWFVLLDWITYAGRFVNKQLNISYGRRFIIIIYPGVITAES